MPPWPLRHFDVLHMSLLVKAVSNLWPRVTPSPTLLPGSFTHINMWQLERSSNTHGSFYVQEISSLSNFWQRGENQIDQNLKFGFSGLSCLAALTHLLTLQCRFFLARVSLVWLFSPTISRTNSSLWMPSDLFKLALQGGCVCVRAPGGICCLPPPRDKKTPPWACQNR